MRASDQDRDEAVRALSEHYADGRLDHDEFESRMTRASEATYLHDLDPLFADLPSRSRPPVPVRAGRSAAYFRPHPVLAVVPLVVIALVAAVLLTQGHAFWILFPLWWFGMGMMRRRSWQRRSGDWGPMARHHGRPGRADGPG
jgi:hypothetical protein